MPQARVHSRAAALMFAGVLLPLLPPLTSPAPAAESATIEEILDGNQLFINQRQARVKARAAAPEVISTRDSRGQLAFSGGAAGRINRSRCCGWAAIAS